MNKWLQDLFENARNPKGILGWFILKFMNNFGHKHLANWASKYMVIIDGNSILDVGCGGGGNISRLLKKHPNSIVDGVDYSPISVSLSRQKNKKHIKKNRCKIIESDVQCLPFLPDTYDIVTAFDTIYYWKNIEKAFKEVFRVLKSNGTFTIVNGSDAEDGWTWDSYIDGMHTYTPIELENHLLTIGFKEIKIFRDNDFHYLCVIAEKA